MFFPLYNQYVAIGYSTNILKISILTHNLCIDIGNESHSNINMTPGFF